MGTVAGCCRRYCGCHRELDKKKEIDSQTMWFDHDCTPLMHARYDEDQQPLCTKEFHAALVASKGSSAYPNSQNDTRAPVTSPSMKTTREIRSGVDSSRAFNTHAKAALATRKDEPSIQSRPSPKGSSPRQIQRYGRKHYRAEKH
uniref:AlNc14C8G1101 protein n=1 Tax=Albugo laibachii Nc14 TaxID=890382 RepID=F0W228_9STRA|nr:AlNc14C8G1101 [Albugo laibachii Nc14]|eukprot:CCA15107.1 AlNc14C8G1101 [Albugo laibachii Nc14]